MIYTRQVPIPLNIYRLADFQTHSQTVMIYVRFFFMLVDTGKRAPVVPIRVRG